MSIVDLVFSTDSLAALGGIALFWFFSEVIDRVLDAIIHRKLFKPIYNWIKRKVKSLISWKDPIVTVFELSFSPSSSLTLQDAKDIVEQALCVSEKVSKGKVSTDKINWSSDHSNEGLVRVEYIDGHYPYEIAVTCVPETEHIREVERDQSILVSNISFSIEFRYPFYRLEDALFNIGSFVSFLEKGLDQTAEGNFSGGRFVISPVESDLSLDEWIQNERFEPSLLLSSEDETAEVEFFSDRAVVSTPYREVDSETVGYIRAVLLHYYLDS